MALWIFSSFFPSLKTTRTDLCKPRVLSFITLCVLELNNLRTKLDNAYIIEKTFIFFFQATPKNKEDVIQYINLMHRRATDTYTPNPKCEAVQK